MKDKSLYDQMRDDIHKVYHTVMVLGKLEGIPTETLHLMREASIAEVNRIERGVGDSPVCCGGGCGGGCMNKPSV